MCRLVLLRRYIMEKLDAIDLVVRCLCKRALVGRILHGEHRICILMNFSSAAPPRGILCRDL